MKAFARMLERVIERFMNIVAARVEASLEIVAANAQRELLEEAARHGRECELAGDLLVKKLTWAAGRFDQLPTESLAALPESAADPPAKGTAPKGNSSGKGKRGRPRKVEAMPGNENEWSVPSSVVSPTQLDKESA